MGEKDTWYLDNGASNHMTGDKRKFVDLNIKVAGNVCFGDNIKVEIKGKGTILFQAKDESHKVVHDVYYIPKLRSNILSIGQLMETGCKIIMESRTLYALAEES